ncbi:tRNA (guanosine(46)-N7)-methyltransferase TrmB [Gammaproteobacteria bacterium]|nr:tRNA (guanosine(46)-N7)-methyltransferase TrmB [Gammaproteobacteria bacterium]
MKPSHKLKQKREVTSFVRRAGRITSGQKNAWQYYWELYGIQNTKEIIETTNIFNNSNRKLIIEIGFGNGEILIDSALRNPDDNFIGIEVYESGIGQCLIHLSEKKLSNVRLINEDAKDILNHSFKDQAIDQINIFFPDPWPKKKHHKRRLINQEFILLIGKKLKKNGCINIATDWDDYAEQIIDVFNKSNLFKKTNNLKLNLETKFEKRGLKLGHKIQKFTFQLL